MIRIPAALVLVVLLVVAFALTPSAANVEALVTVGSPTTPFAQNKQNEPGVAINPIDSSMIVAGVNDEIDLEACNAGADASCPFTQGVGLSGVYFSFNGGASWTQINDSAHQWYYSGYVITGDPNLFGRVYIATNGRGIIYGDGQ